MQKVVWDGKTVPFEIQDVKLTKDGFKVTFTKEVDPAFVKLENLRITQWWYEYSRAYGSPKIGEKESVLNSTSLSKDGKTLYIKMPLEKKQVYCLDLSQILDKAGRSTHNSKTFYTLINLIE